MLILLPIAAAAAPVAALETDQFYAWKRPLKDATEAINAKINADIDAVLGEINSRRETDGPTCAAVLKAIRRRFKYLIFPKPELWATKTSLLERVPASGEEEFAFRRAYLFGATSPLDPIRFMPPSPTIEVNGVRIGTDKLSHFFSEGAWLFTSYSRYVRNGMSEEEAVKRAMNRGLVSEKTILGASSSGVLSLADIEVNQQGLSFWKGLCGGPDPDLEKGPSGWRLKRPFDLAPYVTPEWDESWQPSIYTASRWRKVKPVMERYCPLLRDPEVLARRVAYAARSGYTPSERRLHELVLAGKLEDPTPYTIEAVCGLPRRDVLAPP